MAELFESIADPEDDTTLLSLLKRLEREAIGSDEGEFQREIEIADDYYMAKPVGRLAPLGGEDQTDVVSHMLLEVVEWTKPELLRMFLAGPPVQFDPMTPADVDAARRETQIINHVITARNPGYVIYNQWFQDALVQRNGYVHAEWVELDEKRTETYENLLPEQLLSLSIDMQLNNETVEFLSQEPDEEKGTVSVEVEITARRSYVKIENCPPEDMRIASNATIALQEAPYAAQILRPTRSDLISQGFDEESVMSLPALKEAADDQTQSRNTVTEEELVMEIDKMMEQVRVVRAYVRMDFDEDGYAELRRIDYGESVILQNEPATMIGYAALTPYIRAHRHAGLGMYDTTADLQEMDTVTLRQLMDNSFASTHNALAVNDNAVVDYDDFLINRPNPLYRFNGSPQQHMTPVQRDVSSHRLIPLREHIDMMKEQRTGVGRTSQGLNPEVLQNSTADAFNRGLSASSTMREGIARTFAETGVKDLMLIVHRLMLEHQDHEQLVLLQTDAKPVDVMRLRALPPPARAQALRELGWEAVDPRHWRHRRDMTPTVGLGHNNQMDNRQGLMAIGQAQQGAMQMRVATPEDAYNLYEDMVQAWGFQAARGRYFTHPAQIPPPQSQENPLVTIEKIKGQNRIAAERLKAQISMIEQQQELSAEERQVMINALVQLTVAQMQTGAQVRQQNMQVAGQVLQSIGGSNGATQGIQPGATQTQGGPGPQSATP